MVSSVLPYCIKRPAFLHCPYLRRYGGQEGGVVGNKCVNWQAEYVVNQDRNALHVLSLHVNAVAASHQCMKAGPNTQACPIWCHYGQITRTPQSLLQTPTDFH